MKVSSSKIYRNWLYILAVMIIGFFLIVSLLIVSSRHLTETSKASFYAFNINEKKIQLQNEITNRIDEINRERQEILEEEKRILNHKIQNLYGEMLQYDIENNFEDAEVTSQVLAFFESKVLEDSDYLYFAIDTQGTMLRSGTDNTITGNNLYDLQDEEGNYYIREITTAKNKPEGIYVDYYWPKTKNGDPLKKTSYCLYLPEYNFIIGTGTYHEDIQEKLQDEIYGRLQEYYENKENYIFVTEYDSTVRVSANPQNINTKLIDGIDYDGDLIHDKFMKEITDQGYGFVNYKYYKRNADDLTEKISFVHDLEGWDAYIGMGFYIDDLNQEVNNFADLLKTHFYNEVVYLLIGVILLSIIIFALFQRGSYMQNLFLKQGDIVFEKLFHLSDEGIIVLSKKGSILYENELSKKIFHGRSAEYIKEKRIEFDNVTQDVFSLTTDSERQYYLKLRMEEVSYKAKDCIIYFMKDISQDYLKSNALEFMAYTDELTGIPNRRSFLNDLEDTCFDMNPDDKLHLALLDIDKFKNVNDQYGHNIGDQVLQSLAETFTNKLRHNDSIYRYGGEEFIVTIMNTDIAIVQKIIMDVNKSFDQCIKETYGFNCTFSAGIASIDYDHKDKDIQEHILKADQLLYKAKENGRNRVEI